MSADIERLDKWSFVIQRVLRWKTAWINPWEGYVTSGDRKGGLQIVHITGKKDSEIMEQILELAKWRKV